MISRTRWFSSGLLGGACVLVGAASCRNEFPLGEFSETPPRTGEGGSVAMGGGGAGAPALFTFRTGFETGDDSEFRAVGRARTLQTGELLVGTEAFFAGKFALRARLVQVGDQALELLEVPPHVRVGAHYWIASDYETADWVLMKFRTKEGLPTPSADVFDIDVNRVGTGEYRLVLWEHGVGEIAEAGGTFFEKTWLHLEAEFTASSEQGKDGRLIVFADGVPVMDTGPRATIQASLASTFAIGSVADWITPLPADVFIDDVHVDELP